MIATVNTLQLTLAACETGINEGSMEVVIARGCARLQRRRRLCTRSAERVRGGDKPLSARAPPPPRLITQHLPTYATTAGHTWPSCARAARRYTLEMRSPGNMCAAGGHKSSVYRLPGINKYRISYKSAVNC